MLEDIRVVHIEDSPVFTTAVDAVLRLRPQPKIHVRRSSNLAEGIQFLRVVPANLVLLDLSLPDSQGIETFRRLHRCFPTLPVIIMSGDDHDDLALQAMKEGAQDYLQKSDLDGRTLSRAIQHAIERQRLAAQREDFISALVHDIKNPLIGTDKILHSIIEQRFGRIEPELEEIAKMLRDSNQTLLELLKNLMEIYYYDNKTPDFVYERVDVSQLLENCLRELSALFAVKQLEIEKKIDHVSALLDRAAMKRVFLNLLGNSIKFTPAGGTIALSLEECDSTVQVCIKDSGEGISDEEQKYLFQRYYQSTSGRQQISGSGLGLYVCKQIIEAHQGSILCESLVGKGTSFLISLPSKMIA